MKNNTQITGQTILSTIKTMSALSAVAEKVLQSNGISEIDPEKYYSFQIRRQIHQATLDRFGEIALVYFGFNTLSNYPEWKQTMANFIAKEREKGGRGDPGHELRVLEKYLLFVEEKANEAFRSGVINGSGAYGYKIIKISENCWEKHITNTSQISHWGFTLGTETNNFLTFLSDFWDHELSFQKDESEEGSDWCKFVIRETFNWNPKSGSADQNVMKERVKINEALIVSVMRDAENQKNLVENQKEELKAVSKKLAKYLPPQIHEAVFAGKMDTQITTRRKKLSIFFSDIKNFTSTSEGLQPEDLTKYLNEYFSEMTAIAIEYGATIDKYIGDAMMVFFGDPSSKGERQDARACVRMALMMQDRMKVLQEKWSNEGFADPFQVRMGVNTGYCNVGNFGSDQRLTYTIIGGEVNVAQRLEAAAAANGLLISYETYAHVQDMIDVQERDTIKMKGISREIKVFESLGRKERLDIVASPRKTSQLVEEKVSGAEDVMQTIVKRLDAIEKTLVVLQREK